MKTAFDKFKAAIRDITCIIAFSTPLAAPEARTSCANSFIDILFNEWQPIAPQVGQLRSIFAEI
ncbi:hypothetical protein WG926_15320 [Tistrella sp. BH-R2-4]|uniref:Uncharacterized protein n=1 Tax=Tistrella arctica TaxID=3133430 RepID=A0ABU9YLJ9_9PROT